eukprot:CAMPEP_0174858122 /NCGR_PEP_ID=MMETSP1114-20130205/41449_1 /TAXON_ID=312471 /ORGANISM="Neobodo designis, Strain CCAP 1951/1" /LENGTH=47 /DNA_ID= /DNA_START= /DNA_END= /DNA_ORIENTATION=
MRVRPSMYSVKSTCAGGIVARSTLVRSATTSGARAGPRCGLACGVTA